ncbi:MAG: glycoside hydrolase family 20 zincin-like fold domain-containing protein [Candidatus Brocadiia bacterium]
MMSDPPADGYATELRRRGYAVLPAPRQVELAGGSVALRPGEWGLRLEGVDEGDVAVRTLQDGLAEQGRERLPIGQPRPRHVDLALRPDAVEADLDPERQAQAYRIELGPQSIALAANGAPGLLYAVHTLLQLAASQDPPQGTIVDWPEYAIRAIHWDTKHHQDRLATLRRYLDQAAAFKINAVVYELEDKFAYPSNPVIGAPGAWSPEQLQGLADYALERHIQLIPDVQGPAHMAYVLKHPEFAHLRCDGSNYQTCMDEPEARKLLFQMYDDLCQATRGCRFFLVSTDEVYYAGICEKHRKPYNPENRSLTWVDYVQAAHDHLTRKGREVIIWAEYPLLEEHTALLPPTIINGVAGKRPRQTEIENERGIRQFTYVPIQGGELLVPNYLTYADRHGTLQRGRLESARHETLVGHQRCRNCIGTIAAAWDDSGLHNETFWLGWAMMAQASWSPGLAVEQAVADFADLFYGPRAAAMGEAYRDLQRGARFFAHTLERLPSKHRGPAYGNSEARKPIPRRDLTLLPPALPERHNLKLQPAFRTRYAEAIAQVPARIEQNDRLLLRLQANLTRARRNRYHIEVLLSIARRQRHFLETLLALDGAEAALEQAAQAAQDDEPRRALGLLDRARRTVQALLRDRQAMFRRLKAVWERSRLEKGRAVGGRTFLHAMDDVKDHLADRRPDLTYVIAHEEDIGLEEWLGQLGDLARAYAAAHGIQPPPQPGSSA